MNYDGNNNNNPNKIKFTQDYVGGNLDDNLTIYKNMQEINKQDNLEKSADYSNYLNYENNINKNKNPNDPRDMYYYKKNEQLHLNNYRINNVPTVMNGKNFSNPIIYPYIYDPYFEYLEQHNIFPVNNQVKQQIETINIDSKNRNKYTQFSIQHYENISKNNIEFTNDSKNFKIYINDANKIFKTDMTITLQGFRGYTVSYTNIKFTFTNNSKKVITNIKPNYDFTIPYYDIFVKFSDINFTGNYFKNIPIHLLNQEYKIYTSNINSNVGEQFISFDLPIEFRTSNIVENELVSNCSIEFYNIGNYPLNLINANVPLSDNNLTPYLRINDVSKDYIQIGLTSQISINNNIELSGKWENNMFYTGENIQIGIIQNYNQGYINSNNYVIPLNKKLSNICSIAMISSIFPNVQKNINSNVNSFINTYSALGQQIIFNTNNKLYWSNILDNGIYNIELPTGDYSYTELKNIIERQVYLLPRISSQPNLILKNYMDINFNQANNITTIQMFDLYSLPNCLASFKENNNNNETIYKITINHPNHNQQVGNEIEIQHSLDFYYISKNNINGKHKIAIINSNDSYTIILKNINLISDSGDTKGGNEITIRVSAIFKLYFNYEDTFGSLIGFKNPGDIYSITQYSNFDNNYILTNIQPYYNDINNILIVNKQITFDNLTNDYQNDSTKYIFIKANTIMNKQSNAGAGSNSDYFYKILMNGQTNSYVFNTFVDSPIMFDPPLEELDKLELSFYDSNNKLVNFNGLEHSFVLQIRTISNIPENTNITTNVSRI